MVIREERLGGGRGFVTFTRSHAFASSLITSALELDQRVRHILYVPHSTTGPELGEALGGLRDRPGGPSLTTIPFERCADPGAVRVIEGLPADELVVVISDLRRMVTDRLDVRRTHIRRKQARKKIVVDTVPYEVAPWKIFFPIATVDRHLLGYHHSYALEQDREKFLDGLSSEDPCAAETLAAKTWPVCLVDEPSFFAHRPAVDVLRASAADHSQYAIVRDRLFNTEKSITGVKGKLARWIQERYPERSIPVDLKRCYPPGVGRIVRTDLPFDTWLAQEIQSLMDHTDDLLRRYAERQQEADRC